MTNLIRSIALAAFLAAGGAAAQQQASDNPDNPHSTQAKDKQTADVPSSTSNQQIQQGEVQNPQSPDYRNRPATTGPASQQALDQAEQNNPHHPDARHGNDMASAGMDHEAMAKNATPQMMLQKLHMANQEEIAMAKMAEQNGTDRIKSYAETILHDHQDADQKVKDLAKKKNVTLSDTARNPQMQEKMESAKEHMQSLKGQQFDKAFASKMAMGHHHVISMVEAWRQNCSDQDVCNLIDSLLPKLQQHERMANQLRGPVAQGRAPESR
ncbi:MAG TPA: DUF4142 domain-containing protein [Myxococcales bacterium]|nr:DUF4142 domain-containing protein [Myxococcales bacterium]